MIAILILSLLVCGCFALGMWLQRAFPDFFDTSDREGGE